MSIKMDFFTIGVYNSSEEEFFNKLKEAKIDTFCDIRQRRGVRGSKYAFVNNQRLQTKLKELDIKYGHIVGLAPTKEIRELQKEADVNNNELKRNRRELGKVFRIAYKSRILSSFNIDSFIEQLENLGAKKIVLFCVEEKPQACHRSIVGEKLQNEGYKVINL